MSRQPDSGRRSDLLPTVGLALLPIACGGLPLLVAAGGLGALGSILSNPWLIGAAVAALVALVAACSRGRSTTGTGSACCPPSPTESRRSTDRCNASSPQPAGVRRARRRGRGRSRGGSARVSGCAAVATGRSSRAGRLAALLEVLPADQQPGVWRRIGDGALFLAGVFPEYAERSLGLVEVARLQRATGLWLSTAEGPVSGLLEELAGRAYQRGGGSVPRAVVESPRSARRVLTLITDRYLFPVTADWLPTAGL